MRGSHSHWDHLGDPSTFPSSTDIIVGPGFRAEYFPRGQPIPDSPIKKEYYENRNLREISAAEFDINIAGFPAFDYFGDGSFYLMDSPGVRFHASILFCHILCQVTKSNLIFSSMILGISADLLELLVTLIHSFSWEVTSLAMLVNFVLLNTSRFLH
jgi:hypothetical protein